MKNYDLKSLKGMMLFFLMIFVFILSVDAKKPKTKLLCKYNAIITNYSEISEKAKMISFDFNVGYGTCISNFVIKNSLNERIYIEWENARFDNSRIIFKDESRLMMKMKKTDEAVSSNSYSMERDIQGEKYVMDNYVVPYYSDTYLKRNLGEKWKTNLLIPIRYMDNKTDDICLEISIWFEQEKTQ